MDSEIPGEEDDEGLDKLPDEENDEGLDAQESIANDEFIGDDRFIYSPDSPIDDRMEGGEADMIEGDELAQLTSSTSSGYGVRGAPGSPL